jgi:hypothetical protein
MEKETLEEAFKKTYLGQRLFFDSNEGKSFEEGAKLQQEQMFDIMQQYAVFCVKCDREKLPLLFAKEWFEQFKNK